jgi:hypothetical protein
MRKHLRVVAALAIVFLIAAACSKPKSEVAQTGGEKKGASALDVTPEEAKKQAAAGGGGAPKSVAVAGPAGKGYAALNPGADLAQAKKIGALIKLQSTKKVPNSWAGVTNDQIKLTFNIDKTNCGVNIVQLAVAAGAATAKGDRFYRPSPGVDQNKEDAEEQESLATLVRYWNDHIQDVAADVPQADSLMKKLNKPGHNVYGRRLTYNTVDGGSFQCPEKQTSAAVAIANTIKPFSVVSYDVPGLNQSGYNLSAELKAKAPAASRPMHFGLIDTSDKYLQQWAPYNWAEFQSITKMSRLSSSWICSRLKGKKAVNAHSPNLKALTRKFALLYPNNPNANQAAIEFKSFLKADCGLTFSPNLTEFQFNDNPARAPDEGNTIAIRLKQNNVTSVIYLIDFLGALFHIINYDNQDYRPELIWNGTGAQTNTVQRAFTPQSMVDKASMGYTSFGIQGFGYGPGDAFWTYHTYHKVSPKTKKACDPRSDAGMMHDPTYCRAPGAIVGWYYSWLPLIGGMIFAGPDLKPQTVSAGLQAYPLTRYGVDGPTTDPVAVLVGAGPGQYYFITDGSEFRWRSDFVSPPPESLLGFPDFPDCQRHYLAWPDKLAPLWEKSGPNYNAWCGSPKYASASYRGGVPYAPRKDSETTCAEDTVSGKCQTDNYPRWTPIKYR